MAARFGMNQSRGMSRGSSNLRPRLSRVTSRDCFCARRHDLHLLSAYGRPVTIQTAYPLLSPIRSLFLLLLKCALLLSSSLFFPLSLRCANCAFTDFIESVRQKKKKKEKHTSVDQRGRRSIRKSISRGGVDSESHYDALLFTNWKTTEQIRFT